MQGSAAGILPMNRDKKSGSRFQPKGGLTLLHEDRDVLVVNKPAGLLTIGTDRDKTRTAHFYLNDYVRKGDPRSKQRVFIVHRLDRDTSGILLFARSEETKLFLQQNWEETEKRYLAVVHGTLAAKEGTLTSYLVENAALNVYSTADASKGKLSRTTYRVLRESRGVSLLEIELLTGRKHQIRVHFAEQGHPVVGDRKYGREDVAKNLFLHAQALAFTHPFSGQRLTFTAPPPDYFSRLVGRI
jgi:tRNA pseudouridine32 synthase/23S rRNA pseudouridine746 synthase/23S rRNA pseudouridine1911/1915/1917 synthase